MKKLIGSLALFSMLVTVMVTGINAESSKIKNITENQIIPKSQFLGCTDLNNAGTIKGDLYIAGHYISSIGTIEGDIVAGAKSMRSSGTVSGDIITIAESVDISGTVEGDIRCAGENLVIGGEIGKNVNFFAGNALVKNDTLINGNLLAAGEYIKLDGKVKGHTKIFGNRIILSGEFFGDVDINLELPDEMHFERDWKEKPFLTVLSGTVIHGNLSYKMPEKANIESGAQVGKIKWTEIKDITSSRQAPAPSEALKNFFRMLLSAIVYFLIAMLIFKIMPSTFSYQGDLIAHKPFKIMWIGFLGVVSILASLIALGILIALSVFFKAPMLGIVSGLLLSAFYTLLFYLATIPVSIWLGNTVLKNQGSIPVRFGTGLGIISITVFVLNFFKGLSPIGHFFGFLSFIIMFAVILTGIGALLVTFRDFGIILRRNDDQPKEPIA